MWYLWNQSKFRLLNLIHLQQPTLLPFRPLINILCHLLVRLHSRRSPSHHLHPHWSNSLLAPCVSNEWMKQRAFSQSSVNMSSTALVSRNGKAADVLSVGTRKTTFARGLRPRIVMRNPPSVVSATPILTFGPVWSAALWAVAVTTVLTPLIIGNKPLMPLQWT
jgi:hypothetical protein